MQDKALKLDDFLSSKGITDPAEYLSRFDDDAVIGSASTPLVEVRGSVHMMLNRWISRSEVDKRLGRLRHV